MARRPTPTLTDGELRLMNVLWSRGASTVLEIQERLEEPLVDSTIRTLLGVLEGKGWVRRRKAGRAFVYEAVSDQEDAREGVLRHVVQRFFATPADLVLNLLDADELDAEELDRISEAIERKRGRK